MPDQVHKRTIYQHIQVMETHARQLERELAEAKAELKKYTTDSGDDSLYNVRRLRKELTDITKQRDTLADALASLLSGVKDGWFNEGKWWHTGIEQAEQALATTKGAEL
jgi:predicted negative regulator of RcsB-dependent stress response